MKQVRTQMEDAVQHFADQLLAIRPGVVTASQLEVIKVDCYDQKNIPIKSLATVTVGRTGGGADAITIRPHDRTICGVIQKTLEKAGHNCYVSGNPASVVFVSVPKYTTTADKERAVAQVRRLEEEAKVTLRNIRKKARQKLAGSEDEVRKADKELQGLTDTYVSKTASVADSKVGSL